MIPWAKGWLASQALDAHLVGPSFGTSRYKYYRHFKTSRLDFLLEEILTHLPRYDFSERDYRASGELDFGRAVSRWASEKGLLRKRSFIVTVGEMWGGYPAIMNARSFLYSKMLGSKNALRNVYEVTSRLDPRKLFVGIHFRAGGDFVSMDAGAEMRGQFNMKVPVDWYHAVCASIQSHFGDKVQFHFFTDKPGAEFQGLVDRFNPGQTRQSGLTEISDLILLSQADLRVCSVSSYSMMAAVLSAGPYVWYEPQLGDHDGILSLWGHEDAQRLPGGLTHGYSQEASRLGESALRQDALRGFPVLAHGAISDGLIQQLRWKLETKNPALDLLQYGALPAWVAPAK